ncbi:thiosulfate sulfurtransferase 16, chloroplastic-like [Malania oleifera]|uniref:thiosulfate sulfurtransferase 16, chloroplastic-like n=1 Tax=Malania oleifera TaxID=397392 RepID=UPI0025AE931A|nr:thiosulfate sulfurtransferase 16, chloroplastic-like [Malania oleifera]
MAAASSSMASPSACFNHSLSPPLLGPQNVNFSYESLSTTNPQRRGVGARTRSSNFHNLGRLGAVEEKVLTTGVNPTSVPVRVARELLQAGHRYLDVRTAEEFSAGHASGAINVPYMFKTRSGMTKNPHFLEETLLQFGKDDEIIVACQSGKRSLMAAADLLSAGFTGITDMAGGYAAWTQIGLPTE